MQRVHGGALPRPQFSVEFASRVQESTDAKRRIGLAAVRFLKAGELILLDAGTTPLAVIEQLPPDLALTVVTHSLPAATALAEHPVAQGIIIGGRLFKSARASRGVATVDAYRQIRPDVCILGATAVHPSEGMSTIDPEEAEVKRAMVASAPRVIMLATGEKLGTVSPYLIAPAGRLTHLITDRDASPDQLQPFRDLGIEVVIA